ncbi:MAG: Lon protease [candidate division TM6 bacterium GW2011_GWF2_38_10]|nr:MAG: Lon protease [candidate division TM6 bacterium GW2011_GWF2_38_10]
MTHNQTEETPASILPIIPTIDVVVFPHMVVPLLVLDEKIIKGVEQAMQGDKKVLLLAAQQSENYHGPIGVQDLFKIGTVSTIMRIMNLPDGGIKVLAQGVEKALVEEVISGQDLLQAKITETSTTTYDEKKAEYQLRNIQALIERISATGRLFSPDFQAILSQIQEPDRITDFILSHLDLSVQQAQALLEKDNLNNLLDGIYDVLSQEVESYNVQERIRNNTRDSINKSQREYYLREQMKAIQKELGEEGENENDDLREKVKTLPLTEEAKLEATRQLRRLEKTAPDSMEATVIRNHLELLLGLPWGVFTKDNTDIKTAKTILESNHFGLDEAKDRILDFLSIRFLNESSHTPILCLAGPPGVGKTSLGESIAKALGRKYFRISLGGVYDECEIRGHRRTYVGALPGRFIQAIKKSESSNPLIIIDEIDKLGMSNRGDPAAALLEVLDPEQNHSFYDNYLGVHFDLSKVMFIATANDLSTIPGPLRDRMEIIQLSGYAHEEKLEIAERHLIQRALKNCGLNNNAPEFNRNVLSKLITSYTREAGVRELGRYLQKLCAKYARALVESNEKIAFSENNIEHYLGPCKISQETFIHSNKIGVSNGLAWTPYGGELLQIEAVLMRGNGRLLLTGQLGDVMKESAQAAITYAKAHADLFTIDAKLFNEYDLHIHVPAGAVPKDGPSAGITLLSAILSALTGRAINGSYAMTGELNLQGNVLPIGGLKEKILAAKQFGLHHVIIPKQNARDLSTISQKLYEGINLVFVDNVEEVLNHVLMPQA